MTEPNLAGAVALDVEPDARNFYAKLRSQVLPQADALGRDIGREMGDPIARQVSGAVTDGVRSGSRGAASQAARTGEDMGTALSRTLKARVDAAVRSLPEAKLRADSTDIDRKVANIRRQLAELRDVSVDIEIGDDEAVARVQMIRTQLVALARQIEKTREAGGVIPLELDALKAGAEITRLKTDLADFKREAARPTTLQVRAGSFERELHSRVQRAIDSLPVIELDADSTDAQRDIANIRSELATLADQRIDVDVDAGTALARVADLQARLATLSAQSPNIAVRVDAGAAEAQLASVAVAAQAASAVDVDIDVDVDTGGAIASITALVFSAAAGRVALIALATSGALLATLIIPAAAAAVVAIMGIATAAFFVVAAIAPLVLAFIGVVGAVGALNEQQKAAGESAAQLAARQAQVASATEAVTSAQRNLSNARADADDATRRSATRLRDAELSLAQAQATARRETQGLTRAREEARRAIEDLNFSVREGEIAQEEASIRLIEAQEDLDRVRTDPAATDLERRRAQASFDRAKLNTEELAARQKRLAADARDTNRKGVEGSTQVQSAQERIARAQDQVRKAAAAVTEAQLQQATTARQNAASIAAATQAVTSAQRNLAQAYTATGDAGAAAALKVSQAMAGLSPAGREFARFIFDLKTPLADLRRAAETGLLPGLQAGIEAFMPVWPQVINFVSILATALGGLFEAAGKALASPFWQDFFRTMGEVAGPAIAGFGSVIGDLARGFGSLLVAFLPVVSGMGSGLAEMASGFADWAASLSKSQGFADFVAYVQEAGPRLLALLGDVVMILINVGEALAPLAGLVLGVVGAIADWLAQLEPGQLLAVAAGIGAIAAAIGITAGGPLLMVVTGIGLVVGALTYAYTHWATFRAVVDAVVAAVGAAAMWLWNTVLRPTFAAVVAAAAAVGAAAMWLWTNAISPAITGISAAVSAFWTNVGRPVFAALSAIIRDVVGPVVVFLWRSVFTPAFQGIQVAVSVAWALIQVTFGLLTAGVRAVGAVTSWLWREAIKPAWDGIAAVLGGVWETVIRPVFSAFGNFIKDVVAPAFKIGVDAIKTAWDLLIGIAKAPVKFVVETILNNGLLAAYNWVARTFNFKPDDVHIDLPAGFAAGGWVSGPGGPTDDMILARLSAGEYVIPARVVESFGVGFFDELIGRRGVPGRRDGRKMLPGDTGTGFALPAFAEGGLVGWLKGVWDTVTDPIGALKDKVLGLLKSAMPTVGWIAEVLIGMGGKTVGGVFDFLVEIAKDAIGFDDGGQQYIAPASADMTRVQQWIRSQAGKPYLWASAGPDGYDCSGIMSSVYNQLTGRPAHMHTFSTSGMHSYFQKPGHGPFTAGWALPGQRGASPGVGHTAGQLLDLPFESRGGDGVVVGPRATNVDSFARVGHYDTGGWLMPGITVARNDTGRPEPVLTGSQWDAISRNQAPTSRSTSYNIYPRVAQLDAGQLQALVDRQEALARVGREE